MPGLFNPQLAVYWPLFGQEVQSEQTAELDAPTAVEYLPAGHCVQEPKESAAAL